MSTFLRMLMMALACSMGFESKAQVAVDSLTFRDTIFTLPIEAKLLRVDKLGQLYVLTQTNSLEKYSSEGELLFRFNDNDFGPIYGIDVTNPLQVVLWVKAYQKVVILDRTLNPLSTFLLESTGIAPVDAICVANQNQLWLYDLSTFRFKLLSGQGKVLREGQDLSLVMEEQFRPRMLWEHNNRLFVIDQTGSVSEFDTYGAFIRRLINIGDDAQRISTQSEGIVYQKANKHWWFSSFQLGRQDLELKRFQNTQNIVFFGKRAYVADGESVRALE